MAETAQERPKRAKRRGYKSEGAQCTGKHMVEIRVDLRGFEKLSRDLKTFAKRGVPYAIRDALNGSAFAVQKEWKSGVRQSFTLRNRYTEQSIRVDKAKGTNVGSMQSVTGTIADYMDDQEFGASTTGPVPGPAAAGNAPGSNKRTRLTRSAFRFGGVGVSRPTAKPLGKRRQNAIALAIAVRKGERFALLNRITSKGKGIFEVKGGKRGAKTKLIWSLKKGSMKVKPTPTLTKALAMSTGHMNKAINDAFIGQLKRNRVMGY